MDPFLPKSMSALQGLDALFVFWQHTIITRYSTVVTIQDEVEYFWKSPRSFIKFLYFLNRYFRIPSIILELTVQNGSDKTITLGPLTAITCALHLHEFLILNFAPVILQVRLYALYGRSKFLSTVVGILCGMEVIAAFLLIGFDLHYGFVNYPKDQSDLPTFIETCSAPIPSYFFALGIPYIIFDFLLFALATFRSLRAYLSLSAKARSGRTLIGIMLRDSIIVFVITFLLNVANILTWEYGPHDLYGVLVYWTPLIPAVFANHMLINLKQAARLETDSDTQTAQTAITFSRRHWSGDRIFEVRRAGLGTDWVLR
ncbi:hypothetical protein BD779DRAFT_1543861 [Infundibulicybe gibba]|nr:hypothetical protein BD779DRAFT_1543861 [Infundibulicybe gibba]